MKRIKIRIRISEDTFTNHYRPQGLDRTYVFSGFEGEPNVLLHGIQWSELEVSEEVLQELVTRKTPNWVDEEYGKVHKGGNPFFDVELVDEEKEKEKTTLEENEEKAQAEYEKRQEERANSEAKE